MALSKDKISDIKNRVNIVDIISQVTPLTKTGRHYLGLCPFHKEKTPSFNVVEDKQFYHCFGCGKSGDVFKFLEETRQISFIEAVRLVAEDIGEDLGDSFQVSPARVSPHQSLYDINKDAARFYHTFLMTTTQGQLAKTYLAERGLTDDILTEFQIGLAPDGLDFLYQRLSKAYDESTLADSGLFSLTEGNRFLDSFRNRIIFPLSDEQGRTIGFSGRIWQENGGDDQQAKYKNTRATAIFNKSAGLYHLDKAKSIIQKTKEVYLMEGFMDVIAAHRAGIGNAVATMGTALTPDHVSRLRRYAKKLVLTYDGDAAGQAAIAKSLDLLSDFQVDIVSLPDQLDPDEFLQKHSPEELSRFLSQVRISQIEFFSRYLLPQNLDNLQAQIAYVDRMADLIVREPSLTAQNTYIHLVADALPDFNYLQVEQVVNNLRLQGRQRQGTQNSYQQREQMTLPATPPQQRVTGLERVEQQLFYRLSTNSLLLDDFRYRGEFHFMTPSLQRLYEILLEEGELTSQRLGNLSDEITTAYYQVQSLNFPDRLQDNEIQDLLNRRDHYLNRKALSQKENDIREYSKQGDVASAEAALEALIAQKRQLE